jgi:hypothetical protein
LLLEMEMDAVFEGGLEAAEGFVEEFAFFVRARVGGEGGVDRVDGGTGIRGWAGAVLFVWALRWAS